MTVLSNNMFRPGDRAANPSQQAKQSANLQVMPVGSVRSGAPLSPAAGRYGTTGSPMREYSALLVAVGIILVKALMLGLVIHPS